jgi:hypothetical protein
MNVKKGTYGVDVNDRMLLRSFDYQWDLRFDDTNKDGVPDENEFVFINNNNHDTFRMLPLSVGSNYLKIDGENYVRIR